MAWINATVSCVLAGDLDGAARWLAQVAELPAEQRLDTFAQRLGRADQLLATSRWRGNRAATALADQITAFRKDSAVRALTA